MGTKPLKRYLSQGVNRNTPHRLYTLYQELVYSKPREIISHNVREKELFGFGQFSQILLRKEYRLSRSIKTVVTILMIVIITTYVTTSITTYQEGVKC